MKRKRRRKKRRRRRRRKRKRRRRRRGRRRIAAVGRAPYHKNVLFRSSLLEEHPQCDPLDEQ